MTLSSLHLVVNWPVFTIFCNYISILHRFRDSNTQVAERPGLPLVMDIIIRRRNSLFGHVYTYVDSDVISSLLSMRAVIAAMMYGKEM